MAHHHNSNSHRYTPRGRDDCSLLLCWVPDLFTASASKHSSGDTGGHDNNSTSSAPSHTTPVQSPAFVSNWNSSSQGAAGKQTGSGSRSKSPVHFAHINQMFLRLGVEYDKLPNPLMTEAASSNQENVLANGKTHLLTLDLACVAHMKRMSEARRRRMGAESPEELLDWIAKTTSVALAHSEVLQLQGCIDDAIARTLQGLELLHSAAAEVLPETLVMLRQSDFSLVVWSARQDESVFLPVSDKAGSDFHGDFAVDLSHIYGDVGMAGAKGDKVGTGKSISRMGPSASAVLSPIAAFHRRFGALYLSADQCALADKALSIFIAVTKALPPEADADSGVQHSLSHAYSLYAVVLERLGRTKESSIFDSLAINKQENLSR